MKTRKVPISYAQLKAYCSEYKKTEQYDPARDSLDCRKDAFTIFNKLVDVGFLTRTGTKAEDLREKLVVYTVIHSFSGNQTIFTSADFESYARGIAGQANVVGVYLDLASAVESTKQVVMEALGKKQIQGNFDIKNVDKVKAQLQRSNNFLFGKISNAGNVEYFTIHQNLVNRNVKYSNDIRTLYNTFGRNLSLKYYDAVTYKSQDLDAIIDDKVFELSKDFAAPAKVEEQAAVFYAPVSDAFYMSLTGKKIGKTRRKTYIYTLKNMKVIDEREQSPTTPEEDLEVLQNEVELDVFEI